MFLERKLKDLLYINSPKIIISKHLSIFYINLNREMYGRSINSRFRYK
jgi:hypothetical protein